MFKELRKTTKIRAFLNEIWTAFGNHLGDHLRTIWGSFGDHLGIIWGSFGCHLRMSWDLCSETLKAGVPGDEAPPDSRAVWWAAKHSSKEKNGAGKSKQNLCYLAIPGVGIIPEGQNKGFVDLPRHHFFASLRLG